MCSAGGRARRSAAHGRLAASAAWRWRRRSPTDGRRGARSWPTGAVALALVAVRGAAHRGAGDGAGAQRRRRGAGAVAGARQDAPAVAAGAARSSAASSPSPPARSTRRSPPRSRAAVAPARSSPRRSRRRRRRRCVVVRWSASSPSRRRSTTAPGCGSFPTASAPASAPSAIRHSLALLRADFGRATVARDRCSRSRCRSPPAVALRDVRGAYFTLAAFHGYLELAFVAAALAARAR